MKLAADTGSAPYFELLRISSRLITTAGVQGSRNMCKGSLRGVLPMKTLSAPPQTTALSRVLPEEDQDGNIWICSEGCNFRSSPTLLIPSQYVVYFGPVLWSIARFLRSNHQVAGTDTVRSRNAESDLAGMKAFLSTVKTVIFAIKR